MATSFYGERMCNIRSFLFMMKRMVWSVVFLTIFAFVIVPENQKSNPLTEPSIVNTKEIKNEEIKLENQPEEDNVSNYILHFVIILLKNFYLISQPFNTQSIIIPQKN